jgi:benzaldehyde dehydrogenase (NAD)
MINVRQLERARQMLSEAVEAGARVVAGGTTDGPYFRPTVVADVSRSSRLWTEEIFAPIAPVLVVDDDDSAVQIANDTPYGLVDSVLTADVARGMRVARRLRADGARQRRHPAGRGAGAVRRDGRVRPGRPVRRRRQP